MCLILFLTYNLFISVNPPQITIFENQFKNNISTAQRYLYDHSNSSVVLVGSSLSAKLKDEMLLKNRIYNLAFRGFGPMTGLSLIVKSNAKPEKILIEINTIQSSIKDEFIQKLLSPMPYRLKNLFPALRDEYQPINVLINTLMNLSNNTRALNAYDKNRFEKAFRRKKKKYAKLPDQTMLSKRLDELGLLINELEKLDVKTVFFEMPIHEALQNSPSMNRIRSELKKKFPMEKYLWIEKISVSEPETSDGIHLTSKASIPVTKHLLSKLKSF